jgi:hypothetical protein
MISRPVWQVANCTTPGVDESSKKKIVAVDWEKEAKIIFFGGLGEAGKSET